MQRLYGLTTSVSEGRPRFHHGGSIRPNNFRKRAFHRAVVAAGLDPDLTPHDLRDTAATIAFALGATVKEVQRMLGHSKAAITLDRYTGILESMAMRTDERLEAAFRAIGEPEPPAQVVRVAVPRPPQEARVSLA